MVGHYVGGYYYYYNENRGGEQVVSLEGLHVTVDATRRRRWQRVDAADACSALPFEKGRTPMLSAITWITDITTVQNIVIIAIVSNITTQI
jgi:hypothetical protein